MISISDEITRAFSAIGVHGAKLAVSNRPDLADYMSDAALGAAKELRRAPASIAQEVVDRLSQDGYTATVAGGFVNIRVHDDKIADMLVSLADTRRVITHPDTFVIDSGGPNIAKPMHVGHLRSLVIGDALARILRYVGHRVIKDVHYGDWGFQMGLLLAWPEDAETIDDLQAIYPKAAQRAKDDPEFKAAAQRATVALQNGDPDLTARWSKMRDLTEESVTEDFTKLGVSFDEYLGESDAMPLVRFIERALMARNILVESDGAQIVETPYGALMFRNSEGGYLYAATDLATVVMRDDMMPEHGTHIGLYVVDERQALHFKQVFEVAQQFSPARLEHVGFGTVNGPDGKPFKTRAGGVPRLADLMDEAISKAAERNPASAKAVAIAALKFGDLINRRTGSYTFDLDKALRFEGKTGAYMLYQVARIRSIIRQAEVTPGRVEIADADERALALHLLGFFPVVERAAETRMPHLIAEYAYETAQRFARFYTGAPIKSSRSRLALAKRTEATLAVALDLLGIQTVNEM